MKEWSYTTTPPMGRTAYTELQCLYKGDLYLYLCYIKKENIPYKVFTTVVLSWILFVNLLKSTCLVHQNV
jgi:hypothetical protein